MIVGAFVLEPKVAKAKVVFLNMSENNLLFDSKAVERSRRPSYLLYGNNIGHHLFDTMFNSKREVDYMNEINRLFPKTETESLNMAQNYSSPFQTAVTNKSSSSPDSISPESYFDMQFYNRQSELITRCETPKPTFYGSELGSSKNIYDPRSNFESPKNIYSSICNSPKSIYGSPNLNISPRNIIEHRGIYESPSTLDSFHNPDVSTYVNYDSNDPRITESPFPIRRQRPIVGRKILGNSQLTQEIETSCQFEGLPLTPPERNHRSYELFPSEKKGLEINTTLKQPINPPHFDTISNSPISSNSLSNYMQNMNNIRLHKPSHVPVSSFSSMDDIGPSTMCTFCRKNGETPVIYMTHCVKKKIGNRHVVTCPILRSHVCLTCGASGDNAHTITYCPVLRSSNNGKPLQSTTITLKNTRVKSNGRRRF